ncbi:sensor domain-containing diguanylate cyclase [Inhella gelatinilytica]|uniref:Diguanylate cyclase n=1 Tax=Inhella gelatinilytica TaxID=2795030 RepID=A0A931IWZ1_9BURK|nr:sensor domain-containing diguanylate cyclase [Inhella gelatinilytica]MBH9552540.1 diguanylate cyclase [Inhella gelatinilytica]
MLDLLDHLDSGVLWLDAQGRIGVMNRWLREAACVEGDPCGLTLEEAFGNGISPKLLKSVELALRSGRASLLSHAFHPTPLPLWPRRGDRSERLQQAVAVEPAHWAGQAGCVVTVRDLSEVTRRESLLKQQALRLSMDLGELRRAQDELKRQSARLREVARLAPVALLETDLQGHLLYCNDRFLALWNGAQGGVLGRHWSSLMPAAAALAFDSVWRQLPSTSEPIQRDINLAAPGEPERWIQVEACPLTNLDGERFGVLASLVDVTELYRRAQRLEHRALHDPLTGLPNREKLMQRLEGALAAAKTLGHVVPVIFMDLDGFKQINDEHGHAAGDALLQGLAQRMRRTVRGEDVVARLAGDEFVLVLSDSPTQEQVDKVMGKMATALSEPLRYGDKQLRVGCSWGMACYPHDSPDAKGLLILADERMYAHKQVRKDKRRADSTAQ